METLVEVRGLTKTFRRDDGSSVHAVKGIDLDIHRGEIFSLLGPNGAGKTTTISMISGLLEPTAGEARIGGHSITQEPLAAKRLLGNGYCGRPRELDCQYETICESCTMFFTTIEHRDTIQAQRDNAAEQGHDRRRDVYDALLTKLDDTPA